MDQHHVVPPLGRGVIEDDGSDFLRVRVRQAFGTRRPASLQGRQLEAPLRPSGVLPGSAAAAPPVPGQPRRPSGCSRATAAVPSGLVILVHQRLDLLRQVPLELEHLPHRLGFLLGLRRCSASCRRPSIASSTCSAMTGPTLPRSSRIVSILRATRIRNSRSASRSPTDAEKLRRSRSL